MVSDVCTPLMLFGNLTIIDIVSQPLASVGFTDSQAEDLSVEILGGLIGTCILGAFGFFLKKCFQKTIDEDEEDLLGRGLLRSDDMTGSPPVRLLIVGATGDGKSTLVNALRDPKWSNEADTGKGVRGITKDIRIHRAKAINGRKIELLDSPGVGDRDVTPAKLITLLEKALEGLNVDGVLVTTPTTDASISLAAQIVKELVAYGFAGGSAWKNIVLVGTKADRATKDEREFLTNEVTTDFFPEGVSRKFALTSVSPPGCCKGQTANLKSLFEQISRLPSLSPVNYQPPSAKVIAESIFTMLGTREAHAGEVEEARRVLNDRLDEQKRQAEEEKQQLQEKAEKAELARQEEHRKAEEAARLAEEEARRVEEARKVERKAAEKAARVDAEQKAAAEERAKEATEQARKAEEAARLAEEEVRRVEEAQKVEREAAEKATRADAEQKAAAEERAKEAAEQARKAEEEARRAKEEARRVEEARKVEREAAEKAARADAEQKAAVEKRAKEATEQARKREEQARLAEEARHAADQAKRAAESEAARLALENQNLRRAPVSSISFDQGYLPVTSKPQPQPRQLHRRWAADPHR